MDYSLTEINDIHEDIINNKIRLIKEELPLWKVCDFNIDLHKLKSALSKYKVIGINYGFFIKNILEKYSCKKTYYIAYLNYYGDLYLSFIPDNPIINIYNNKNMIDTTDKFLYKIPFFRTDCTMNFKFDIPKKISSENNKIDTNILKFIINNNFIQNMIVDFIKDDFICKCINLNDIINEKFSIFKSNNILVDNNKLFNINKIIIDIVSNDKKDNNINVLKLSSIIG